MKRFRLTKLSKIILFLLVVAAVIGGGIFAFNKGLIKTKTTETNNTKSSATSGSSSRGNEVKETASSQENTINLSIDEWVGYIPLIRANGGSLTTQPNSYYDKLGLSVNIHIINDQSQSSNALIKGDLDGAGYTVNRLAFLSKKFTSANVDVIMPFITNYSNGGDGLIALSSINTIDDLVNAKIGVPQFTESHAMVVWFVNQSDLSQDQKSQIINNLILFETADETAKAFFAGQIDVAGTWQPYLTQAENSTNSHILFSTANSTKLILSGIVFQKDFAEQNPETIAKFIDGTLQAIDDYDKDFTGLRDCMPMFSGMSDDDIVGMTKDAALATWDNNMNVLDGDAKTVYLNMCDVWKSIGEDVDESNVDAMFDTKYMSMLTDKYKTSLVATNTTPAPTVKVTTDNTEEILNTTALLTKAASVNFIVNTAKFTDSAVASQTLDEFIQVAKMLDGTIIQIEGNTDPNPASDPTDEANLMLSKQRAETVKQYFIMNGISADRIIAIGNGSSKPKYENNSNENRALNRRTDVSFKIIENVE